MKYNISSYSEAEVIATTQEKDITLSKDSQSIIFQMFSKNIYSNPIGSVVREITSNCFDSHIEAGVKDVPVIIRKSFDEETETHYISFIDFGVGMSPERIDEIFSVMFSSTKRDSNDQIGAFGLGSKTPLAYKRSTGLGEGEYDNSYFIITVFDKIKYVYQIYEGNSSPRISLMHQEATTEGNGTEVRIPVLKSDLETFSREMKRQLYYFENVVFEGFDEDMYVENDYQILKAKTFLFRGTSYESAIHVCLGRVAYPIDYSALGLDRYQYQIPVALKLDIGDIGITVSRESLDYSEKTIKVLKAKLEEAKQEIVSMLEKQYSNIVTLEEYFDVVNNFGILNLAGRDINLSNFIKKQSVNFNYFRFKDLGNMPSHKNLYEIMFDNKRYGEKERAYATSYDGGYTNLLKYKDRLYFADGVFNRKVIKQSYLKHLHKHYYIITKSNLRERQKLATLAHLFGKTLDDVISVDETTGNIEYKPLFKRFVALRDEYFAIIEKHCTSYDELEVPEDFIISRKREKLDKSVLDSSIPVKFIGRYGGKERVKVKDLINFKRTIFYGTQEDEQLLHNARGLYRILFNSDDIVSGYGRYYGSDNPFNLTKKRGIMFAMVAKNNTKIFEHCKNAYHISEFQHRMLYRKEDLVMEYYNADVVMNRYKEIEGLYKSEELVLINVDWYNFAEEVKAAINVISEKAIRVNLKDYAYELGKFFDLTKAKPVDNKLLGMIEKLEKLEAANQPILEHINMPYYLEKLLKQPELVDILQKVMKFDI